MNFSLRYQYIFKQSGFENKENHEVQVYEPLDLELGKSER